MSSASATGNRRIGRNVTGSGALGWWFAGLGIAGLLTAVVTSPSNARSAAGQDWSPFVLVSGLLLIGLVADDDGLFAAAGHRLARTAPNGVVLFVGAVAVVGAVTAVLNLDTSVAFLTPVLVYTARSRGEGEAPLLYGCLLLSNAGSLFLPGSNLTNLIVLGHLHLNGGFLAHTWAAALAALVVTAAVVAVVEHRALRARVEGLSPADRPALGTRSGRGPRGGRARRRSCTIRPSRSPPWGWRSSGSGSRPRRSSPGGWWTCSVSRCSSGSSGWRWRSAPSAGCGRDRRHCCRISTCGVRPASPRLPRCWSTTFPPRRSCGAPPAHPFAMLVGLNLGPNLFVTGSLAWFLWLRAARTAGARPSIAKASRLGAFAVPLSMAAALGALVLTGTR